MLIEGIKDNNSEKIVNSYKDEKFIRARGAANYNIVWLLKFQWKGFIWMLYKTWTLINLICWRLINNMHL